MSHNQLDRTENQRQTDKMIENKLGSSKYNGKSISMVNWNCYWSNNKFF